MVKWDTDFDHLLSYEDLILTLLTSDSYLANRVNSKNGNQFKSLEDITQKNI